MKSPVSSVVQWGESIIQRAGKPGAGQGLFTPVLAPLFSHRQTIYVLVGVAAIQVFLAAKGFPGWPCPIRSAFGIPCPGCGLSTAMVFLAQGEWHMAVSMHIFAPVFFAGFVLMGIVGLLPHRGYMTVIERLARLEQATGLVPFLMTGIMIYWGLRLLNLPGPFWGP